MDCAFNTYDDYRDRIRQLERKFREDCNMAKIELKKLQKTCPHTNTQYEPDASGNNDSYTWCRLCGKTL